MGKKRHAKVFIIANKEVYESMPVEEEMEFSLAMGSVRARCFSSIRLSNVCDNEKTMDWEMKMALTYAMIQTCDAVAVIGSTVTSDMIDEIQLAAKAGKEICVTKALRPEVAQKNLPISAKVLLTICKETLAGGE